MQHESVRLEHLVQQIIELSRLQGDQLVDEPVEVDIPALLEAAVARSRTAGDAKHIAGRGRGRGAPPRSAGARRRARPYRGRSQEHLGASAERAAPGGAR